MPLSVLRLINRRRQFTMFAIRYWVNGTEQFSYSGYHDRDDAYRRVNALWSKRREMFVTLGIPENLGRLEFKISANDGHLWRHDEIMEELAGRPELRGPERIW
jgi:hypothetical protein